MKVDKKKVELQRARMCLSNVETYEKAGMAKGTYFQVLAGTEARPETIGKIAAALECDVTDILQEEG